MKRLLDCTASDFRKMNGKQLKQSIKASEGRVIVAEVIGAVQPLYPDVTNAELVAAFGADLLLLNLFDVFEPRFNELDTEKTIKSSTGIQPVLVFIFLVDFISQIL